MLEGMISRNPELTMGCVLTELTLDGTPGPSCVELGLAATSRWNESLERPLDCHVSRGRCKPLLLQELRHPQRDCRPSSSYGNPSPKYTGQLLCPSSTPLRFFLNRQPALPWPECQHTGCSEASQAPPS